MPQEVAALALTVDIISVTFLKLHRQHQSRFRDVRRSRVDAHRPRQAYSGYSMQQETLKP